MLCVFFFKQKTAYEMRISDWSSDVCSSDLVVEDDARDLPALAGARAIAEEPAAPEPDGGVGLIGRRLDDVPGRIDVPRTGEMAAMGFARENDGFALGVGQGAVGDKPGRQDRKVRWSGRGDRGHRRRLDPGGGVGVLVGRAAGGERGGQD